MDTGHNRTIRFSVQIVPPILFFALLGLTFVDRPNWSVPPPPRVWTKLEVPLDRAFTGSIESPLNAQREGHLMVQGWAAATSATVRVVKVQIYIDGALAGATADFMARPDIAANAGRADFGMSGWQCVVPVKDLKVGQHQLQLHAVGSDGSAEIVVTKNLNVVE